MSNVGRRGEAFPEKCLLLETIPIAGCSAGGKPRWECLAPTDGCARECLAPTCGGAGNVPFVAGETP